MEFWIILGIIVVLVLMFIAIYNRLVGLRQTRTQSFADIDVQLKLRYDLIPNLVETVKGYATHEKELLEKVTEARATAMKSGGGMGVERMQAEAGLGGALMNLMAVAENYPDLKADSNFRQLQEELSDVENKIAAARRFFNNATAEYNTAREQFPAILIANMFGFQPEVFFELDAAEKEAVSEPPQVSFS